MDFKRKNGKLISVSPRAKERCRTWPFGSNAYDLDHKFGDPIKGFGDEPIGCSKEFADRLTKGMTV
jgi:hypothetical protein